ncbi:hypothetical protein DLAC_10294 [Tieghemostelium lacteum]|uniref:TLC domain-containing protein n=1 Tax=Tieghemostelium lacteum TaxID=361077 RepID=A0A151Z577_TIELA|nr:hypothetical protein DLAC_10294 [Tieghemostelium lacteum]|eukprot:KYQ89067.1 hypothetical protein DLAC_10294 [Tieghemostelium lacteum]
MSSLAIKAVDYIWEGLFDENGLSAIEYERAKVPDNSIFLSKRKFEQEISAMFFLAGAITMFFLIRYLYQNYILRPYAKSIGMRRSFILRFLENGWYSIYYVTFFTFGTFVYLKDESFSLFPTTNIWAGWPLQPFPNLYRTYYLLELAFYLHCTIALFYETKRKDFYQMLTHHISTSILVIMSYWVRYHRIGLAILWIHNIADIFLYTAKWLNYVQKENKSKLLYALCEACFTSFAVSFFFSRLVFFPYTLLRSTLYEVPNGYPLQVESNVALFVLVCLHIFWFSLILKIIYIKLAKGEDIDDIRSDSEDEEGNSTKKNAPKKVTDKKSVDFKKDN